MSASTSKLIIELARLLPVLSELDDAQLHEVVERKNFRQVVGYWPSSGETAVLDAARALGTLLERCDRDTVGQVLDVVDRVRAGNRVPAGQQSLLDVAANVFDQQWPVLEEKGRWA